MCIYVVDGMPQVEVRFIGSVSLAQEQAGSPLSTYESCILVGGLFLAASRVGGNAGTQGRSYSGTKGEQHSR